MVKGLKGQKAGGDWIKLMLCVQHLLGACPKLKGTTTGHSL